jgi:hypothetical protein
MLLEKKVSLQMKILYKKRNYFMFIYQLLKEYKKKMGFIHVLLRNIKINKWIIVYLFVSVSFPVLITLLFSHKSIFWMVSSIILYLIILFFGGMQHQRKMYKARPAGSLAYHTQPFRDMLRDVFSITTDEQYKMLDELIKREMAAVEYARKYPLMDIVRQLIVALIVTGLLSYAVFEIREGNHDQAKQLISLYLLIISLIFTVGGILKQLREFGSGSYLHDITFLVQLTLLENSIRASQQKELSNENNVFFPRKNRDKRVGRT